MLHLRRGLCSILVLLMVFQCSSSALCLANNSDAVYGIEVESAGEPLTSIECFAYLDERDKFLFPASQPGVVLAMSDSFGRPSSNEILPSPVAFGEESSIYQEADWVPTIALLANGSISHGLSDSTVTLAGNLGSQSGISFPIIRPSLKPNLPDLSTPTPKSNPLSITSPKKKETVVGNSTFKIAWKLNSDRKATYVLFLSTDNGESYDCIIRDVEGKSYKWSVPNADHSACRIKVEAWVGDVLFAEAVSGKFSIKEEKTPPKKTPQPTATPLPEQASTPAPDGGLLPFDAVNPDAVYRTAGQFFINPKMGGQRWFRYELQVDGAETILWQVSKYPFATDNDRPLSPVGLLVSGVLDPDQNEFVIDFNAIVERLTGKLEEGEGLGATFQVEKGQVLLPQFQYTFYIRAVALDAAGNLLGDAGEGVSTGYGDPTIHVSADVSSNTVIIQTWVGEKSSQHQGQSSMPYIHQTEGIYVHPDDLMWRLQFRDRPANAVAHELQVATTPFSSSVSSYFDTSGLVYREHVDYTSVYDDSWAMDHMLVFNEFAPPAESLGTSTIMYYMRMLFFVQDQFDSSRQYVVPSETQIIYYNDLELSDNAADLTFAPTQQITVESGVPFTRVLSYTPVQWEDPNVGEYYEVSRRIMAQENVLSVVIDGKYVVVPFAFRDMFGDTSSIEDYQQRLDTYLPVGHEVRIKKSEPGVLDELGKILSYVYNSVKDGYEDLQNAVVNVVADNFPFLDDDQREALRDAIGVALDIGLTALGIPPSLPDFEEAFAKGFDYCLAIALEEVCAQMGIPEDAIPDEVRERVSEEVARQIASQVSSGGGTQYSYLRPSTTRCYRPACVEVLVSNQSDQPTVGGALTVGYSVKNHFYSIYKPARLPIPTLDPGEQIVITCYLTPNIDLPVVQYKPGFEYYYYGKSDVKTCVFSVTARYNVKDAEVLALEQGLHEESTGLPLMNYSYEYDHSPVYNFTLEKLPCWANEGDMSISSDEFYK